jgi:uncharacterized protein YjbI with pentapeptide repeats
VSTFERFSLQASPEEWQPAWIARGELRDQRFDLPAGVSGVTFDRARLVSMDFSGKRFTDFNVHAGQFEKCDFSNTVFEQLSTGLTCTRGPWDRAGWPQSVFRDCVFRRTRFAPLTFFGNVRFERCIFDRSRLRDQTSTFAAEFVDCVFLGRLRNLNFWGRPTDHQAALGRDRNDFTGNDFTSAELDDVAFRLRRPMRSPTTAASPRRCTSCAWPMSPATGGRSRCRPTCKKAATRWRGKSSTVRTGSSTSATTRAWKTKLAPWAWC